MITLPATPALRSAQPELMDFNIYLTPATGGPTDVVERKGGRFRLACSYPPMRPEVAMVFVSRLLAAKREGVRVKYPLLEVDQSGSGSPVVNGANQAGSTLNLRGITEGFQFKEGFWLSIVDAAGQHFLHNCRTTSTVGANGLATIAIEPPLRVPFADGAVVHLTEPQVQGLVRNVVSWEIPLRRLIEVQFTLEEKA